MRTADLVTASVLMLLGGVVLYDAAQLGIGWGLAGPGSGFFPFWLATLLVVISALIFLQAWVRPATRPFVSGEQLGRVLQVVLPVLGFIVLTDPPGPWDGLGLYAAASIYLAAYMRWVGRHRWGEILPIAIVVPVAAFFLFERWFLVPMPKGPIEAWFGY